jgi:hypothetical protein
MMPNNITEVSSILDKMDWRKNIQKYLDNCVLSEGTINYPTHVKQLIAGVAAEFPNFNAEILIKSYIKILNKKYSTLIMLQIENNPEEWLHPGKRQINEPDMVHAYYRDIFKFIINLVARKRMLLYGTKKIHGGKQMNVSSNIDED